MRVGRELTSSKQICLYERSAGQDFVNATTETPFAAFNLPAGVVAG
jgi:hypothetical protein